jgi:Cu+-exporting ATPase
MMSSLGVDVSPLRADADGWAAGGETPVFAAIDGRLAAAIAVADPIKASSRDAIRQLRSLGLGVVMLTGDHRATAEAIGHAAGIDAIVAEVRPEGKVDEVRRLQEAGHVVAMVGDGINDAPALAAADLGIAIGSGSEIAVEAAEVVVSGDDLRTVPSTIKLARATLRTIKQNLGWAFLYNVLLIPVAAGLLVPLGGFRLPGIAAAAAMALSSVSVVGNSLLLRARRID